jgi:signal transduction histidine kinase
MSENEAIVERLRECDLIEGVPEAELEWLAAHGEFRQYEPGRVFVPHEAEATEGMFFVLSGRAVMYTTRGGERRKAMEWFPGEVIGLLPYSRMKTPPGDLITEEATDLLAVHRDLFPEMIRQCHETTSRCVHVMIDRARVFTSTDLHDEKLAALGRMAAGLAHELNNPASAVASGARSLVEQLLEAEQASRALGAAGLNEEQLAAVDRLNLVCSERSARVRSPLEQSDFEESILDWLDDHDIATDHVDALAETDLTLEMLDELAETIDGAALDAALRWVAVVSSARGLAVEVEEAASSIHDLVRAVQGFTAMDRALVAEPMDLGSGLRTTVLVLKTKAKEASVGLSLEVEKDLPRVRGFVGELNQVWVNLIANAVDAVGKDGLVTVRATREGDDVVVRVVDNGPGIPEETRQHIFEPFFTTKKVGEGMGLGLDIVRRLVQRNEGVIEVDSQPGRTEFRVVLPALSE